MQKTVDRITLIFDDDTTQTVYGGRVVKEQSNTEVLIEAQFVPREHTGMEVVAANDDGTVEASITVDEMWMEGGTRHYS